MTSFVPTLYSVSVNSFSKTFEKEFMFYYFDLDVIECVMINGILRNTSMF